jgi:hypothetical protein
MVKGSELGHNSCNGATTCPERNGLSSARFA